MTALVNALDNYTPSQLGENGHTEFGWSNKTSEQILQLSFQLTRTDDVQELAVVLTQLLTNIKHKFEVGTLLEKQSAKEYLSILYRLIGQTRDIVHGKGEYALSYMMVYVWSKFYPSLAIFALKCFFTLGDKTHPYGSWKDFKYFCKYCKEQGDGVDSLLITNAIGMVNAKIRADAVNGADISLAAKWIPREKSSFGWLYQSLAVHYFNEFFVTAKTPLCQQKAILKCKTEYRKLLSRLNKMLDTTQIKQCDKNWKNINFNNVTSITLSKQKKAFLNVTKTGEARMSDNEDRNECASHFKEHIQKAVTGEIDIKGKRVSMCDFTKQAIELLRNTNNTDELNLLNAQWRDNSSQNGDLGKMIAMVDVSGSMDGDPLYAAVSLGIRIAEKSLLGKRVMTFSSTPSWVNLEAYPDFVSQVNVVRNAEWGMNTNFTAALDMILGAIVDNKMSSEDVEDMVLVILSDMQMDSGDRCNTDVLYNEMKKKYSEAGIKVNGKPYNPPHILFWNLRSTSGFPCLASQPNTSMMSGFSAALLNLFCEKGAESLKKYTPFSLLVESVSNERYQIMDEKLDNTI